MATIHDTFEILLDNHGDILGSQVALIHSNTSVTYDEVNRSANRLARAIVCLVQRLREKRSKKLRRKSCTEQQETNEFIVGVSLEPSHGLVTVMLAVLKAGGAVLPIDGDYPAAVARHMIRSARPAIVVVDIKCEWQSRIMDEFVTVVQFESLVEASVAQDSIDLTDPEGLLAFAAEENQEEKNYPSYPPHGDRLAFVMFTSGSTGLPKGVLLSHSAIMNRLNWQWNRFPFLKTEVCCFKTKITFVDAIAEIFGPLLKGVRLVVFKRSTVRNVESFVSSLEAAGISRIVLVPSLLRAILKQVRILKVARASSCNGIPLQKLTLWICSGEVLPASLGTHFFQTLAVGRSAGRRILCNFYGTTEVAGDVMYETFESSEVFQSKLHVGQVPLGFALDNTRIYLVDVDGQHLVPEGREGEICVAGFNVAKGYLMGRGKQFVDNPFSSEPGYTVLFRTGDIGRCVGDQVLFCGRKDGMVKIRGQKVHVEEIEGAFRGIDGVDRAIVVCRQRDDADPDKKPFSLVSNLYLADLLIQKHLIVGFYTTEDNDLSEAKVKDILRLKNRSIAQADVEIDDRMLFAYGDEHVRKAAKAVLKAVGKIMGPSAICKATPNNSFFCIGGNSLNAIEFLIVMENLGFKLVLDESAKIVGLSLNYDFSRQIHASLRPGVVRYMVELMSWLELTMRHKVPSESGKVMSNMWLSADPELGPALAVGVMESLEAGNVEVARVNEFEYIVTYNINPVSQQLARILGYEIIEQRMCNQFVSSDGSKPFVCIPNKVSVEAAILSFGQDSNP
ncbi:unnamed protein product [Notodromas monacha]|uniref:AMP-dependent synthetase/ligase domain-containing protein n=1 Tax=Notodromas monacha TaxID=399045 RepID=A0A7R9BER5_9CRUS|nr:unnamed protein product [Notodromas monacha]CAG0913951.1 unnamed protein product [Notodromas monacha]